MGNEGLSGQSAIEYLMTYGWMLLVVAVVGGAVFSVAQSESVDTVSGMEGEDTYINDFGVTSEDELGMDIQNRGSDQVVVSEVNVSDPDTGEWVFKEFTSDSRIGVGSDKIFQIPNVTRGDGANSLDVRITHDSGALENLVAEGTISGNLQLTESNVEYEGPPQEEETGEPEGPTAVAQVNESNPEETETVEFDASDSSEGDSSINSYEWDFDDGNTDTGVIVEHSFSSEGEYNVELNVSDGNDLWDTDTITVNVEEGEETQFYTDFSEYELGETPADWSLRFESDDGNWSIEEDPGSLGGRYLAFNSEISDENFLSWDKLDEKSGVEVVIQIKTERAGTGAHDAIFIRGSEPDGYSLVTRDAGAFNDNFVELRVHDESGHESIGEIDLDWADGDVVWMRLNMTDETLRSKAWFEGDEEPGDWQLEKTDSSHSKGWIGLGRRLYSEGGLRFDRFGVGIDGEEAPTEPVE